MGIAMGPHSSYNIDFELANLHQHELWGQRAA
jgi:hypothetical protein